MKPFLCGISPTRSPILGILCRQPALFLRIICHIQNSFFCHIQNRQDFISKIWKMYKGIRIRKRENLSVVKLAQTRCQNLAMSSSNLQPNLPGQIFLPLVDHNPCYSRNLREKKGKKTLEASLFNWAGLDSQLANFSILLFCFIPLLCTLI